MKLIKDNGMEKEKRRDKNKIRWNKFFIILTLIFTFDYLVLKGISFETAIIERYRRRESSMEEALIEMYLAGVSVQPVEDITEAL